MWTNLDDLIAEVKAHNEDERYPNLEIIALARTFLDNYLIVGGRFKHASFDYDGGVLLDFTEDLVIGISFHKVFFPSKNSQPITRYYFESELDSLVIDYF